MTSYISLLNKIEAFCNAHLQIKKYKGEFREQMPNFATTDEKYPVVFVVPTSDTETLELNQFTLDIYCVDIIQKDRANLNTIVSDCHLILKDLYLYFKDGSDLSVDVLTDPTMTPLNNFDLDYVAGWVMSITFEVEGYSVCAIPMNPITPFTPSCEDATYEITDTDENILYSGSVVSGGELNQEIQDSTVRNSDDSYTGSVLAEGSLTLPDITVTDSNGSTYTQPSVTDVFCTPCEDVNLYVGEANVGSFPSGSDVFVKVIQDGLEVIPEDVTVVDDEVNIILADVPPCPDTNIEVNGVSEGSVVAGSTIDVQLSDSGGTVTPDSVTLVGTDLQIVLPDAPPSTCIDSDAQRFLDATGITNETIESALDTFVVGLKDNGLWYKMDFLYPFLGGTATTTKFNLINPIDADSAFRITWNGGVDFTNGMKSNGTNGYGNTHFNPATQAGNNNTCIGYKSTTDLFASAMEMGAFNTQQRFAIFNFDDVQYVDMYGFNAGFGRVTSSQGDTRGVYVGSRTASNVLKLYRNGSQIGTTSTGVESNVSGIPFNLYIGALNNGGTAQFFCARNLTFAFSGKGLSDTDVANLTTLINNFDTTIGR